MNKLVSRNLIQRFKEGRKIVFAQKGNQFIYSNGNEYWRGGSDWYYRPKGGTGMTRVDYKDKRFYSSTPRGAIANTFEVASNKVSPIKNIIGQESPIIQTKISQPKEANSDINGKNRRNVGKSTSLNQQKGSNNSFKQAFDTARNSGEQEFTWNGKKYNTMKKGETKEQWLSNLRPSSSLELPTSEQLIQQVPQNVPVVESTPQSLITEFIPQTGTNTIQNQLSLMQQTLPATGTYVQTPTTYNFDRTQTRQWLRDNGFNPYSLTGAQRKALRMILNGQGTDEDKNLIGLTNELSEILTNYKYLKQGGTMNILPSRDIVKRFKSQRNIKS